MLRTAVSQITTMRWPFDRDVERYAELGVTAMGVLQSKLTAYGVERGLRLLRDAGITASCYQTGARFAADDPARWAERREAIVRDLETAARLQAGCLVLLTGPGGAQSYEEAAQVFLEQAAEIVEPAAAHRVRLAIEPHFNVRVDATFVYSLHDALDLAESLASPWAGVCCELTHVWMERGLYRSIQRRCRLIAHVQTGDYAYGTRASSERVPLGEGCMPLVRLLDALSAAGYEGYCDLELLGPAIDAMGCDEALGRSLAWLARYTARR
ncbi:MAG: sugar phosphate isomerase/epimerase [Dehalococcoidia bacterium]|nr:sugar phosphate isomerase/epimerase [Dehalococcoidia bacterium]